MEFLLQPLAYLVQRGLAGARDNILVQAVRPNEFYSISSTTSFSSVCNNYSMCCCCMCCC